jgi:hypothetical protein
LKGSAVRHNFAGGITGERCGGRSIGRVHEIVVETKPNGVQRASGDLAVTKAILESTIRVGQASQFL